MTKEQKVPDVRFASARGYRWRWKPTGTLNACFRCGRHTTGVLSRRGFSEPCCPDCPVPMAEMVDAKLGGEKG